MRRRPWLLYLYAVAMLGFLFAPIALVIVNAFNSDPSGLRWGGLTGKWFHEAWSADGVTEAAKNSFVIAGVATGISLALGTLAAVSLQRANFWTRTLINGSTYARIIIPELVLAVAVLVTVRAAGIARGMPTVILGHVLFSTAYVTVIVAARLSGNEGQTAEAARDLGASAWRAFRRVTLPEIAPALVASGLLIFTFSLDNVVTSVFLSGSTVTLPLYIFGLIRFQVSPVVNALGVSMMIVTGTLMIVFAMVNWKWSTRDRRATANPNRS